MTTGALSELDTSQRSDDSTLGRSFEETVWRTHKMARDKERERCF